GTVVVGQSVTGTFVISNPGSATLTVNSYAFGPSSSSELSITAGPATPFTLAPGGSASVQVRYAPTVAGADRGSLVVVGGGGSASASLAGAAIAAGVEAGPASLAFGGVPVGSSDLRSFTVTNTGASNLTLTALRLGAGTSAAFVLIGDPVMPLTLAPGAAQAVQVLYTPAHVGTDAGSVEVISDATPATVALAGAGTSASLAAAPAALEFGNVLNGQASTQTVTIQNVGGAPVALDSIAFGPRTSTAFTITSAPGTPATLNPGATAAVSVRFLPARIGVESGTLQVLTAEGTVSVALSGGGVAEALRVAPGPLVLDSVLVGQSATRSVTLTNSGAGSLVVTSVYLAGGSSS
ncbi:MAG TPA: choice-of-anchor D domain-containing protein, partial [Methylomirabilota bacterium]|nr:choice-of-anchor D domain-containing protein [Methylomirabilota bacterium]